MKQPIVFKLGGEALLSETAIAQFLTQIKQIQQQRPVVIVHGGGPQVELMMTQCQLTTTKVEGVRATPTEDLPFVIGALAGIASQQLLVQARRQNINTIALSLADSFSFSSSPKDQKLGAVGNVEAQEPSTLKLLLETGHLVLLNSIGCSDDGQSLNINADDAAVATAALLEAELCLLSNVPGVLDANKQLINTLNDNDIQSYIQQGVITDGMVVKVKAAHQAADFLRRPVSIGSWQDTDALAQLANTGSLNLGTQIIA